MRLALNPVQNLQDQLQGVKLKAADRQSRMVLQTPAGMRAAGKGTISIKKDANTTESLLGTLASAMAVRRAQLTDNDEDDSEDDWSD